MNKKYEITKRSIIFNFSAAYAKNEAEVLSSDAFKEVLTKYISHLEEIENSNLLRVIHLVKDPVKTLTTIFKLLLSFEIEDIKSVNEEFNLILKNKDTLFELVENFYDYWRRLERYAVVKSPQERHTIESVNFIAETETFNQLILKTYRAIAQKLQGVDFYIHRQLTAGVNASLSICTNNWAGKDSIYSPLNNISFINHVVIRPPFIYYSEKNTRKGIFPIVDTNPVTEINEFAENDWFCFPTMVGSSLTYVYFHKDYMDHGIALSNLFEFVHIEKCISKKPDLIVFFGAKIEGVPRYHYDAKNDIYVGVCPHGKEIDYFGYMKKMLLTCHNTKMLKEGYLPIHGAGVLIKLKSGVEKMLVLMGDSGAGKSETLEALKAHAGNDIVSTKTVFDDMGTFKIKNGEVYAYGTETGAFVRLDDLENGYAYKEMDRSIFMNPNQTNARLVMPVATYDTIMKGYKVDMFFYANNYSEDNDILVKFSDKDKAISVFKKGARVAKGTTSEKGLVESYFANPFGPTQCQDLCNPLLETYFATLFKNEIPVGEIHTRLAVSGMEHKGPQEVAKFLFELVKKEN